MALSSQQEIDNRIFVGVEGLEFSQTMPHSIALPTVRLSNLVGLLPIAEPHELYPLTEYIHPCGGENWVGSDLAVRVYTFAANDPFEQVSKRVGDFRIGEFVPATVIESSEIQDDQEKTSHTYADHVRGIDPDDPLVFSYQWTRLPPANTDLRFEEFDTGAWVVTSLFTDDDVEIEVIVFAGAKYDQGWFWEGGQGERPRLEELIDTPNDPDIGWRFDCVADTWELIEPIVTGFQATN